MTSGERMVWAAVFAENWSKGVQAGDACRAATAGVEIVRLMARSVTTDEETRSVLDDMLGVRR